MSDEAPTKPTLETILNEVRAGFAAASIRSETIEKQLERILIRLDKIESIALEARGIALETQLDLRHLRGQLNIPA